MQGGLENIPTADGKTVGTSLESEDIALLLPCASLEGYTGSYQHLRAAAETICTSELKQSLPKEWQDLHICPLTYDTPIQKALFTVPENFKQNMSFTKVSFKDPHVEPKTFVRQYPYGTGGFKSTSDCVDKSTFRRARFWSLDGEFLDDVDPHWMFWQREFDYKDRLATDARFDSGRYSIIIITREKDKDIKNCRSLNFKIYSFNMDERKSIISTSKVIVIFTLHVNDLEPLWLRLNASILSFTCEVNRKI